jgi:hypothetical protein
MATLVSHGGFYSLQFYAAERRPKLKKVALRTRTRREAEAIKRKLEDGYAGGRYDPWLDDARAFLAGRDSAALPLPTLGEAVSAFLAHKGQTVRRSTLGTYTHTLHLLVGHVGADRPTASISAADIRAFLDTRDANATGLRTYLRPIRTLCGFLMKRGALRGDSTVGVHLPKAPDKLAGKLVTRAYLDAFVIEAEALGLAYLADAARVAYGLALRRGEVCAMRRDWVDLDARTVTVRQGRGFQTKAGRVQAVHDRRSPVQKEDRVGRSTREGR